MVCGAGGSGVGEAVAGEVAGGMERLARGARPAEVGVVERARAAVVAVSMECSGPQGCLPRSIAVALLCRARGQWPTWCVGVRKHPPFGAHAWVEVGGVAIGEGHPAGYYAVVISVGEPGGG